MSCCADCNQKNSFGLDGLLGSLEMAPIQPGAPFSLGVELSGAESFKWMHDVDAIMEDVRIAVQQGGFVQIPVRVYKLSGWTSLNPFIVIEGRAKYGHSSAAHLRDAILSAVGSVISYNAGSVRFEADTYDPTTGQINTDPVLRRYDAPQGGGNTQALPASFAGSGNPLNQLASWLGVGQTEALLIGAGLAIGGVILLKRLL